MTGKRRCSESAPLFTASTSNTIELKSLESALLRSTSDESSDAIGKYQRTATQRAGDAVAGSGRPATAAAHGGGRQG